MNELIAVVADIAIINGAVVAVIAIDIAKTKPFAWLRRWAGDSIFGKLLRCPYCLAHWLALPFVDWKSGPLAPLELFGIVAVASLWMIPILQLLKTLDEHTL